MNELLGLPYSPWTEKARWALDVRQVSYTFRHYQPLLGEPALRLKTRRFGGRVTVPVLTTADGRVLSDSMDIARWADGQGSGPRLFPAEREADVVRLVALSERALSAGRNLTLRRMLGDDLALSEMVPRSMRKAIGGLGVRIARAGIARTIRKYGASGRGPADDRRTLVEVFDELRATLAKTSASAGNEPRTLLGTLTFADLAVAQAVINARPPTSGLRMGEGSRRCFAEPGLSEQYADLVAWRDDLYQAFRSVPVARS
jgi:glutathione S-transferase